MTWRYRPAPGTRKSPAAGFSLSILDDMPRCQDQNCTVCRLLAATTDAIETARAQMIEERSTH